jgi:long-subunit acyl-CoA synthetase (AMP-forming)
MIDKYTRVKAFVMIHGEPKNKDSRYYTWQNFLALGQGVKTETLDAITNSLRPGQVCDFVYTSGTTGNPKGVMLSHDSLRFANIAMYDSLMSELPYVADDRSVSFLPLSHVAA